MDAPPASTRNWSVAGTRGGGEKPGRPIPSPGPRARAASLLRTGLTLTCTVYSVCILAAVHKPLCVHSPQCGVSGPAPQCRLTILWHLGGGRGRQGSQKEGFQEDAAQEAQCFAWGAGPVCAPAPCPRGSPRSTARTQEWAEPGPHPFTHRQATPLLLLLSGTVTPCERARACVCVCVCVQAHIH